jgi:hypothetical protein
MASCRCLLVPGRGCFPCGASLGLPDVPGSEAWAVFRGRAEQVNWNHPEAMILPGLTTSLALLNAHIAFGDKLPLLKRAVMLLPIICLPLTYQLPQALFCYWGTSFAFTTAQILTQRTSMYQKLVQPQQQPPQQQGAKPRITLEEEAAPSGLGAHTAASVPYDAGGAAKSGAQHQLGHEVEDLNQRIQRAQEMWVRREGGACEASVRPWHLAPLLCVVALPLLCVVAFARGAFGMPAR